MQVKEFIKALETESRGFHYGEPWRYDEDSITCVVPILREIVPQLREEELFPDYIVSAKAKKIRIKDMGMINQVEITNNEEKPVFFRLGELLKGDTQERALVMSRIIMPGKTENIEVVCVHASKGIRREAIFTSDGYAPGKDSFYAQSLFVGKSVNQGASWSGDRAYTNTIMSVAGSRGQSSGLSLGVGESLGMGRVDDLKTTRDTAKKIFADVIKKVPLFENQVGMVLIDTSGVHSLDCFDLPLSWKELKEAITEKESVQLSEKDLSDVFEYKPERAKESIIKVLGSSWEEKVIFDSQETKTVVLDTDKFSGEAVLLGDSVIHLLLARK